MANPKNPVPDFAKLSASDEAYFASRGEHGGEAVADDAGAAAADDGADKSTATDDGTAAGEGADVGTDARDVGEAGAASDSGEGADDGAGVDDVGVAAAAQPRHVPISVVQAERERRQLAEKRAQEVEARLRQHEEYRARIDERLRMLNEQNARANQPVAPDPNEDPEGYRAWQDTQREARIAQLEERLQRAEAGGAQASHVTHITAMTQAFAAQTPDYYDVARGVRDKLDRDLELGGYDDPRERLALIDQWTSAIAQKALSRNMNPAEAIHKIGKSWGVGAAAARDTTVAPLRNKDKVATIRRGQDASRSLSRGGARDVSEGLTLDRLLAAEPAEFAKLLKESPGLVNSLMGR